MSKSHETSCLVFTYFKICIFTRTKHSSWTSCLHLFFFYPRWFYHTLNLNSLTWTHNPWDCNCASIPFIELLNSEKLNPKYKRTFRNSVVCENPQEFQGAFIDSLNVTDITNLFTCPTVGPTTGPVTFSPNPNDDCPTGCSCYGSTSRVAVNETVLIVDCGNGGLTELPAQGFPDTVRQLILSYNSISEIPNGYFSNYVYLKNLNFIGNQLTNLPINSFPTGLTVASFSGNQITQNDFTNIFSSDLQTLDLSYNQIAGNLTLPDSWTNLQNLYFQNNQISGFASNSGNLGQILTGNFQNNMFTSFPTATFSVSAPVICRNDTKSELLFDNNQIENISGGVAGPLFKVLSLHKNNLGTRNSKIGTASFGSCLNDLDLSNNKISSLSATVFSQVSNLVNLNLAFNNLPALPTIKSDKFKILSMQNNQLSTPPLTSVPESIFQMELDRNPLTNQPDSSLGAQFGNLERLSMNACNLTESNLSNTWLGSLPNLRVLSLEENLFTQIPVDALNLGTLEKLSMWRNRINSVTVLGNNWSALRSLDLAYNEIRDISKTAFDTAPGLQDLSLNNNVLMTPYARWFKNLKSLDSLVWDQNPWDCNCAAVPFAQLLETSYISYRFRNVISDTVLCVAPQQFNGSYIDTLGVYNIIETLDCDYSNVTPPPSFTTPGPYVCPDKCTCLNDNTVIECIGQGLYSIPSPLPRNLITLNLQNNQILSASADEFKNLDSLTTIILTQNNLTQIDRFTFSDLPGLQLLKLDQNKIENIYTNAWPYNLQNLDLSNNRLRTIDDNNGFSNLYNLKNLYLDNNKLSKLSEGLDGLNKLTLLSLKGNKFENFPVLSSGVINLQTILLDNNDILGLQFSGSQVWSSMQELSAQHNLIQGIGSEFLSAFPALNIFDVSYNNLTTLPNLTPCGNLTLLNLSYNNLSNLKDSTFANCANLNSLNLEKNSLAALPSSAIQPKLNSLNASRNKLKLLTAGTCPEKLNELLLSRNLMNSTGIDNSFLSSCSYLRQLYLDYNELEKIPASFSSLYNANYITVEYNGKISAIKEGDLDNLTKLQTFNAKSNNIGQIDDDAFRNLTSLLQLNLENNFLETPKAVWFRSTPDLVSLQWEKNPWNCDCHSIPFNYLTQVNQNYQHTVQCYNPTNFTGVYIDTLTPQDLFQFGTCAIPTPPEPSPSYVCPDSCECLSNNTIVDCSSRQLTEVPYPFPYNAISINLDDNMIKTLPGSSFRNLPSLRYLILSNNRLSQVPINSFYGTNSLEEIILGNNQITQTDFTKVLPATTKTVDLSSNRIKGSINFDNLLALEFLDLSSNTNLNQITVNSGSAFASLNQLKLDNNQFTAIPSVFNPKRCSSKNLLSLSNNQVVLGANLNVLVATLNLDQNNLSSLPSGYFTSDASYCILSLDLHSNMLTDLSNAGLSSLSNLNALSAYYNQLSNIPDLSNNAKLNTVSLENNAIKQLTVNNLPSSLSVLYLGNNYLTALPSSSNLANLTQLSIDHNNLQTLSNSFISSLTNLNSLDASSCNLTNFENDVYGPLSNLKMLTLNGNLIAQVGTFGSLNLNTLSLSNNLLTSENLNKTAFDGIPFVTTLTLSYNQLETPYARWFRNLIELETLQWQRNPWNCNCASIPFAQLIESDYVSRQYQEVLSDTVKCQSPAEFKGSTIGPDSIEVHDIDEYFNCNFTLPTLPPSPGPVYDCPGSCACFNNNTVIDCSHRNLTTMPGPFPTASTRILVNNNRISTIPLDSFQYLPALLTIDVSSNLISNIPNNAFTGSDVIAEVFLNNNRINQNDFTNSFQGTLKRLELSNNRIRNTVNFDNYLGLEYLDISNNQITNITTNNGQAFRTLNQLVANFNSLTSIPDVYQPKQCSSKNLLKLSDNRIVLGKVLNVAVASLYLDENNLSTIPAGYFAIEDGNCLLNLYLNNNNIADMSKIGLNTLSNLQNLNIYYNLLTNLPNLSTNHKLNSLSAEYNLIPSLDLSLLPSNLTILSLGHNQLSNLPSQSGNNNQLMSVYLDNNMIASTESSFINDCASLVNLDLSFNQLTSFDNVTFSGLPMLLQLNLNSNQISRIDTFGKFNLEQLSLANNLLNSDQIDKKAFDGIPYLYTLDLSRNNLTTPYARWFRNLIVLNDLTWSNNPWICDCASIPFAQLLESDYVSRQYQKVLSDTVECQSPAEFQGSYLGQDQIEVHDIDEYFNCNFTKPTQSPDTPEPYYGCPAGCGCYENNTIIDCSSNQLTELPYPFPTSSIRIDVKNNSISSIPNNAFQNLPSLLSVDISDNQIRQIPTTAFYKTNIVEFRGYNNLISQSDFTNVFSKTLKYLDISFNNLKGAVTFLNNAGLEQLVVCDNAITEILTSDGKPFRALSKLDADSNQLTQIPRVYNPKQCSSNNELSVGNNQIVLGPALNVSTAYLSLVGNNFGNIPEAYFATEAGKCLLELYLEENMITDLSKSGINTLSNLQKLTINGNSLTSFPNLSSNTKLVEVLAGYNQLTTLDPANLPSSLQALNLEQNLISSLSNTIDNTTLPNLKLLDLTQNSLTTLTNSFISNLLGLEELLVNYNKLTQFETSVFESIPYLYNLQISDNQIAQINTLGKLTQLTILNLDQNGLTSDNLAKTAFDQLVNLNTLSLNKNQLTTPYARWFYSLGNLRNLEWTANPWQCDCQSIPFAQLLESEKISPEFQYVISDTVLCTDSTFAKTFIDEVGVHQIYEDYKCDFSAVTTPSDVTATTSTTASGTVTGFSFTLLLGLAVMWSSM